MKRYVEITINYLLSLVIFFPCLITFSQGSEEQPTIWNAVGLLYIGSLICIIKRIAKRK